MELSDLKTAGYCVIKDLLTAEQLNLVRQDFELIKNFPVNKSYPVLPVGKCVPLSEMITSVVEPLTVRIKETSGITTDFNNRDIIKLGELHDIHTK